MEKQTSLSTPTTTGKGPANTAPPILGVSMVQGPENNQNKKTSAAKKRKLLLVEIEEQRKAERQSIRKALTEFEALRHKLQIEEIDAFFAFDKAREAFGEGEEAFREAEEAFRKARKASSEAYTRFKDQYNKLVK